MKRIDIRSMAVGALIGAAIVLSIGAASRPVAKWEYKIASDRNYDGLEQKLNDQANAGWEATGFSIDSRGGLACALLKRAAK